MGVFGSIEGLEPARKAPEICLMAQSLSLTDRAFFRLLVLIGRCLPLGLRFDCGPVVRPQLFLTLAISLEGMRG